jgi:glycogen debranching enzyme
LNGEDGEQVTLVFADSDTLLFQANNVGLRLMPSKVFPVQYSPDNNQIQLIDWFARGIHMFRADVNTSVRASITPIVTGIEKHLGEFPYTITYDPRENISTFLGEIRFSRYETFWNEPIPDFNDVISSNSKAYSKWMSKIPNVPETYQIPAEITWTILWNCQVPIEGMLTRPTIYMSKFWMNRVWAWDNLFNAIAVANANPQLAWDQLMLFFDYQDPNGMIPDKISDMETISGFTKPPLHGWAIRKLVRKIGLRKSLPYLNKIYKPLSRLTEWWYTYRYLDRDGLPQYFHGNDSSWDNSTVFDQGYPVKSADLAAYLVLQCECLSFIAETVGWKKAAIRWKSRAEKQRNDLLTNLVSDDHFFSSLSGMVEAEPSRSLINYLPLILGNRLPNRIRNAMINDLRPGGAYLTQYGLASEPPSSIKYMPDGYWRSPIRAASTYLIFDGLVESGEIELAHLIAERFCNMCLQEPVFGKITLP